MRPQDFWSYYQKGLILEQLADYQTALECYQKALEIELEEEFIYRQACCYALLNKPNWAITYLERAIELYPTKYLRLAVQDRVWQDYQQKSGFQALIEKKQQQYL